MISSSTNPLTIRGRITEGLKEASFFTKLPWVREQFITKMGIDPCPGTLNLEIADVEDVKQLKQLKRRKGIKIIPAEPGFCSAKCFPVLVSRKIKGVLVIPLVPDYPESKLEIVSSDRIRETLSLKVGDVVLVEVG
jgi:CTP-dependent riboflavin kinase